MTRPLFFSPLIYDGGGGGGSFAAIRRLSLVEPAVSFFKSSCCGYWTCLGIMEGREKMKRR